MASSCDRPESGPQLAALLAGYPDRIVELCLDLRRMALNAIPEMSERINPGWRSVSLHHPAAGYVCGLFPRDDLVKVGFEHGRLLHDPDGVLVGAGRQLRYLCVTSLDNRLVDDFTGFVHQAVHLQLRRSRRDPSG